MAMNTREVPQEHAKPGQFIQHYGTWFQLNDTPRRDPNGVAGKWILKVVDWEGTRMSLEQFSDYATVLVDGVPSAWKPSYLRSKARRKLGAANELYAEAQRLERRAAAIEKGN